MAAGPNALRGSGPNRSHAHRSALTQAGSPDPRNDRICITSSCPRQFVETPGAYAACSNSGSLNCSPRTIMAQAMRAILLASATAATLIGLRSMIRASHSRFVPCCLAYRMASKATKFYGAAECRDGPAADIRENDAGEKERPPCGGLSENPIEFLDQAAVRLAFSTSRWPAIASSTATLACSIDAMA